MVQQEGKKLALQRELGLVSGTALIVGTMIGSGIFVTPGGVLKQSGSVASSLIIWALSGLTAVFGEYLPLEVTPDANYHSFQHLCHLSNWER